MTEKANPSINRTVSAFKTAGALAYAGSNEGFISPDGAPTEISQQDDDIAEGNLNAFDETSDGSSLDVTIDGGEAFVFGSWIAIDSSTTVSLDASTAGQTVFVGWNKDGSDDVIVGVDSAFASASGDADQKIPLWTFDTDGSGVTAVTDERSFDQIGADSVEQGAGSGLDADMLDGNDSSDFVSSSGDTITGTLTVSGIDLDGSGITDLSQTFLALGLNGKDLRMATGQDIEDGGGNRRFTLATSGTEIINETGTGSPSISVSSQTGTIEESVTSLWKIRDATGSFDGVTYRSASTSPGTLELSNADLDIPGALFSDKSTGDLDIGGEITENASL